MTHLQAGAKPASPNESSGNFEALPAQDKVPFLEWNSSSAVQDFWEHVCVTSHTRARARTHTPFLLEGHGLGLTDPHF